jgi:hypothetical protein
VAVDLSVLLAGGLRATVFFFFFFLFYGFLETFKRFALNAVDCDFGNFYISPASRLPISFLCGARSTPGWEERGATLKHVSYSFLVADTCINHMY